MPNITERTVFETRDGKQFPERADAEFWDQVLDLGEVIEESTRSVYGEDARDIASFLLTKYIMTKKE
jgi:hypothetical protein